MAAMMEQHLASTMVPMTVLTMVLTMAPNLAKPRALTKVPMMALTKEQD